MKGTFPIDKFQQVQTPFYYYDTDILRKTWEEVISVPEPDRPDLTLHVDNTGTMAKLMETADAVATTITTLGKI